MLGHFALFFSALKLEEKGPAVSQPGTGVMQPHVSHKSRRKKDLGCEDPPWSRIRVTLTPA